MSSQAKPISTFEDILDGYKYTQASWCTCVCIARDVCTYIRTYAPTTYLHIQHCVTALRCRDKNSIQCLFLPHDSGTSALYTPFLLWGWDLFGQSQVNKQFSWTSAAWVALFPVPRPAFRRLQYGKATKSWAMAWERGYSLGTHSYMVSTLHVAIIYSSNQLLHRPRRWSTTYSDDFHHTTQCGTGWGVSQWGMGDNLCQLSHHPLEWEECSGGV